jgi:hypothetical protein
MFFEDLFSKPSQHLATPENQSGSPIKLFSLIAPPNSVCRLARPAISCFVSRCAVFSEVRYCSTGFWSGASDMTI